MHTTIKKSPSHQPNPKSPIQPRSSPRSVSQLARHTRVSVQITHAHTRYSHRHGRVRVRRLAQQGGGKLDRERERSWSGVAGATLMLPDAAGCCRSPFAPRTWTRELQLRDPYDDDSRQGMKVRLSYARDAYALRIRTGIVVVELLRERGIAR